MLGIGKHSVIRYERGERIPDADLLRRIVQMAPSVDAEWLLLGEPRQDHQVDTGEVEALRNDRELYRAWMQDKERIISDKERYIEKLQEQVTAQQQEIANLREQVETLRKEQPPTVYINERTGKAMRKKR